MKYCPSLPLPLFLFSSALLSQEGQGEGYDGPVRLWGHWHPSVICCFSSTATAGSTGLALHRAARHLRHDPAKALVRRVASVSPNLLTALTSVFQVKKFPWDHCL